MKVLPVQQHSYSQNNKNTSFKGAKLAAAMSKVGIPNNQMEWKFALSRLTRAVNEEPALRVFNTKLFNELKSSCNSTIDFTLYMRDNAMSKTPGYVEMLARDNSGPLVTLVKNYDQQFMEFNNAGEVMRFGLTEPMEDNKRHLFFQKSGIYIDYHDEFGTPAGGMRKYQDAFSDAKYYDREGNREFAAGLKGLFQAICG